jgi:hypothetical protein
MQFSKILPLALPMATLIFIFPVFFSGSLAEAKTSSKNSPATTPIAKKKWAVIDGFRSAKFGMDVNRVKKAIAKDFKISSRKIKLSKHATQKTVNLAITVPELFAAGGPSRVIYVFGHESKKLIQINVFWGANGGNPKNANGQSVVDAANLLRTHFVKKRYKDGSLVINGQLAPSKIMVFRGADKKGRMAVLVLDTPKALEGEKKEDTQKKISLQLSYILNPEKPDILTIEEGMF